MSRAQEAAAAREASAIATAQAESRRREQAEAERASADRRAARRGSGGGEGHTRTRGGRSGAARGRARDSRRRARPTATGRGTSRGRGRSCGLPSERRRGTPGRREGRNRKGRPARTAAAAAEHHPRDEGDGARPDRQRFGRALRHRPAHAQTGRAREAGDRRRHPAGVSRPAASKSTATPTTSATTTTIRRCPSVGQRPFAAISFSRAFRRQQSRRLDSASRSRGVEQHSAAADSRIDESSSSSRANRSAVRTTARGECVSGSRPKPFTAEGAEHAEPETGFCALSVLCGEKLLDSVSSGCPAACEMPFLKLEPRHDLTVARKAGRRRGRVDVAKAPSRFTTGVERPGRERVVVEVRRHPRSGCRDERPSTRSVSDDERPASGRERPAWQEPEARSARGRNTVPGAAREFRIR